MEHKLDVFREILKQTNQLCFSPALKSLYACTSSLSILKKLFPSIEEQDIAFKDLVGHRRDKRGLFDAVGKVFKIFIGTLDEEDAKYYNDAINDLILGERDLSDLMKTQIQVVQSTITNFNNSMTHLHHTEEIFNKHLSFMYNFTSATNRTLLNQDLKQNIGDHITLLLLLFTELNREYSNLIQSILFAKQNTLHPSILTPTKIMTELSKTKMFLPPNTNYPLPLSVLNAYELMDLLTLSVYYTESKLIFVIEVPITENDRYTLYHLLPVPTNTVNSTYVFIKPSYDYLALSLNKLLYTPLTTINCKTISNDTYICHRTKPLYNSYSHKICESELLINYGSIPKSCDVRLSIVDNEIWYKLRERNKWLYVAPRLTHVTIDCRDNGIFDLQIKGTGFLSLKTICKAYTQSVTLISTTEYSTSIQSFMPNFDITFENGNPNEPKIATFDFTPLHTPISNLDELKTASFKLDQLSSMIDQTTHKEKTKDTLKFHENLITCIIVVFNILIVYYIYKCINRFKRTITSSCACCTRFMINSVDNETDIELRDRELYESISQGPSTSPPSIPSHAQTSSVILPIRNQPIIIPSSPRRSARLKDKL